jgi:DNA-binding NtrC family response regulator
MAHEINNPNNYILLNAKFLSRGWREVKPILDDYAARNGDFVLAGLPYSQIYDKITQLFLGLIDGSKRIQKIVQSLKDFSRDETGSAKKLIDINEVVEAAITIVETLIKKSTDNFKDLYYRLQAHHIRIPPLRERLDDVPLLIEHHLESAAQTLGKKKPAAPRELATLLRAYHYPGNVRELEGMIFDAVSRHSSGVLSMTSFREKISQNSPAPSGDMPAMDDERLSIAFSDQLPTLEQAELLLIEEALRRASGNQAIAASLLGLSRRALNNRLQRQRRE